MLDFVNERDEIFNAFKPYYEVTPTDEANDPHQLYDLKNRLEEWRVFEDSEINAFCDIWFRNRREPTPGDHQKLNAILDEAVQRYVELSEDDQGQFKGQLSSFRKLYVFLSQIISYQDSDLEKLYTYGRFLLTKLPLTPDDRDYQVEDDVALKFYRLQKISEGAIDLKAGEPDPLKGPTEVGTGTSHDDDVSLSSLINMLNERFGTQFTPADQLFFDQVTETAAANEKLQEAARVNTLENFSFVFNKMLEGLFIERMEGNEEIFTRLMNDDSFRGIATEHLVREVYEKIRKGIERGEDPAARANSPQRARDMG